MGKHSRRELIDQYGAPVYDAYAYERYEQGGNTYIVVNHAQPTLGDRAHAEYTDSMNRPVEPGAWRWWLAVGIFITGVFLVDMSWADWATLLAEIQWLLQDGDSDAFAGVAAASLLFWGPFFMAWLCKAGADPERFYGDPKIRGLVTLMRQALVFMVVVGTLKAIHDIATGPTQNQQAQDVYRAVAQVSGRPPQG